SIVIPGSPATTPVTQVNLNLNTVAGSGATNITITNPDGQSATGNALLTIVGATPTSNSPVCAGNTLNLFNPAIAGATYSWTGPNGFTSSAQNPSIPGAGPVNAGQYDLTV